MAYQVAVRLGTSSPVKAGGGSTVGAKSLKGRPQSQRQPLFLLLGVPHEDQAAQPLHTAEGLGPLCAGSRVGASDSGSNYEPRVS